MAFLSIVQIAITVSFPSAQALTFESNRVEQVRDDWELTGMEISQDDHC